MQVRALSTQLLGTRGWLVPVRRTENPEVVVRFNGVPQIMVILEQPVVHQIVVLNVVGSNPTSHPKSSLKYHK